jgi:serine/threonine protein kinase/dipeptidyl aminopeptidase/acylaminoacyl peptidase
MIGKTLAHYEVLSKLGEGGMGVVYLARDTKLGREVALKILPDHFAKDKERLARFHREARTLAALNHPNIAAIHGLESDQGINFLAMELAEGEDLSVLIDKGPVPVDEALNIARHIAQGLEEAHGNGIIHRDLKPANVKVSADGKVKVLDFGLARAFMGESTAEEEPLNSPTITAAMTGAGVILGTAAYMSPEQARGTGVDRRSDIWSFGAVVYEMLTGHRLFQGDTISDTLAGILKSDPDWEALPEETPDTVKLLLVRCLERDRTQRLQDIGEARIMLTGDGASSLFSSLSMTKPPEGELSTPAASRRPLLAFSFLALILGAALGGLAMRSLAPAEKPFPLRRLEIALPAETEDRATEPKISPDGTMAVFVLGERLWLRRFGTGLTQELPGTEEAKYPFWSPDSRQIGFFVKTTARRMAVDGGAPQMVCDMPDGGMGAGGTWDERDHFLFTLGDSNGIMEVPSRGGTPVTYIWPDTTFEQDFHDPHIIDDGRGLLFSSHQKGGSFTKLFHFREGNRTLIFDGGDKNVTNPVWCESGHVLFGMAGANSGIWGLKFDPDKGQVLSEPFLVVGKGLWPSVATDRTLLCSTGSNVLNWQLVKCDRTGRVVSTHGEPQEFYPFFSLGPQGRRMVLAILEDDDSQLWMIDLERNTQSRLTFDDLNYSGSTWMADGEFIIASGGPGGPSEFDLIKISVEGSVPAEVLTRGLFPFLTPDQSTLLYSYFGPSGDVDIASWDMGAMDSAAEGEVGPGVADPKWQYGSTVSPDGGLLTYVSRETGRDEVYMRRYPQGDQKRQISADGGAWPMWNAAGDRIFYMNGDDLLEVELEREPSLRVGSPKFLFTRPRGEDRFGVGWPLYFLVTGDGKYFYMLHSVDPEQGGRPLTFVQNWVAEFEEE